MASTGPKYPTSSADGGGGSGGAWTSLTNIYTSNDAYAVGDISAGGYHSSYLQATGYGFSIPSTATINGIMVEVERNGIQAADYNVQIIKGGSQAGTPISGSLLIVGTDSYATFGGISNLWGTTWTPSDINAANFGAAYQAVNTHGGGTINVDTIRITVFWTAYVAPQSPDFPKSYIYKVYRNDNTYLGDLPNVSSIFSRVQDINTAGAQISINVVESPDTSSLAVTDTILDEAAAAITDESDDPLLSEGADSIAAVGIGNSLIKNGNRIVVWEYSYYWPNGHVVFSGEISRWEANYGGETADDSINVLVYGDGTDMDDMLLLAGGGTATADQVQTTQNTHDGMYNNTSDKLVTYNFDGQTFTVGSGVTNLGQIDLMLDGTATVTVAIYDLPAQTTLLGTITQAVSVIGPTVVSFSLAPHIIVTSGTQYFFSVSVAANQNIDIYYNSAGGYAGGQRYMATFTGVSGGSYLPQTGTDLYFKTYSTTGTTTATFTGQDPTIGMLKPFMDDYINRGGLIGYTGDSIDPTGLSLTYTFNTNTILEGIKAMASISPFNFYWFVDLSTNILYFKQRSSTPDVLLTKGVHIERLKLVASIENIKNTVYFVGGVVAGSNLYKTYQDATSQSLYGQKLDRKTDNRVTVTATADAIGNSAVASQKDEQFQTMVTVTDKTMDISLLHVGMIIGFRGFGNFVDTLILQVARVEYSPDEATLTLGGLPPQLPHNLEQATRQLIALQTVANPSAPS